MSDRIKISREFKDSILGGLWLGLERDIPEDCEDISGEFKLANDQLVDAFKNLSPNSNDAWPITSFREERVSQSKYDNNLRDAHLWTTMPYGNDVLSSSVSISNTKEKRKEEVVASLMLAIELAQTKKATEFFRKRIEDIGDEKLTEAFENKILWFENGV